MFIEKELDKNSSPFQKDHVYILRGVVNAERYTLAGTVGMLVGTEGGMVVRLKDIEDDDTEDTSELEALLAMDPNPAKNGYDDESGDENDDDDV